MFSGLVINIGKIIALSTNTITISSDIKPKIGASIAVNGICLTNINCDNGYFEVNLSEESKQRIAIENIKINNKVHLEEALRVNDRLDGHIVQGHIDSIGIIEKIEKNKCSNDFWISFKNDIKQLIIPKGSICIDGISLTINECYNNIFRLTIIPYTFNNTLFKYYKVKRRVNIETDILARTINHILKNQYKLNANNQQITRNILDGILASY